jgi:dihydrofolate reductase/thymidylate synthase
MHGDYTGKGVDQVADVIHRIRTNPTDRRIVLTAWNPAAIAEMALPPCHMFCQFYVDVDARELSCTMYQRSGDMGLGVPFNIASYALLTSLIAQVTGYEAGDFVHVIGDAHVYANHVEPLLQQLEREPRPFPTLRIDPSVTRIEDFELRHLTVEGYDPHGTIRMDMAV